MGFVEIENTGKRVLEQFPVIKRSVKRVYQLASYATSREKIKFEGDVVRVSPADGYEYFYGYYDKSPWDATDRYMIALKVKQAYKAVAPKEPGIIVIIDTKDDNKVYEIGTTHSWNVQQGCMAQWLGLDFKSRIIYNDFREGKYCSVIYNIETESEERELPLPVYDVARDGSFALSLDFSRLHRMRPGYGYSNITEETKRERCPDKTCIWKMDIETGKITELFKYTDMANFEPVESMKGAEHKVNHLMISPNGRRFMVLHRWFQKGRKHTRLVTVNADKTEMYNLSDDVFVSHCFWKNDDEILSFLRKSESGNHYYLMKDKTHEYKMYWPELNTDGHCSYSPDGKYIIADTYPNRKRIASVYLCTEDDNIGRKIASSSASFRYDNDCRCDLHPRWNRKGDKVCIDSVHEGKRGLYVIDLSFVIDHHNYLTSGPLVSLIVPCYNAEDYLDETLKSIEKQIYNNIEVICIDDGSIDNTSSILKHWSNSALMKNTVISQSNHGVSFSRNIGIENSHGKYVMFLDSDDLYREDLISLLVKEVENNMVDTAYCRLSRNKIGAFSYTNEILVYKQDQREAMNNLLYKMSDISFDCYIYNLGIIRRLNLRYEEQTKFGEDREFNWKYLSHCEIIAFIDTTLYYYRINTKSATKSIPTWEKTDLLNAVKRTEDYLQENNCSFYDEFKSYMYPRSVWTVAKTFSVGKQKKLYKRFISEYNIKPHMKCMLKDNSKVVVIGAVLYLINPFLFYFVLSKVRS